MSHSSILKVVYSKLLRLNLVFGILILCRLTQKAVPYGKGGGVAVGRGKQAYCYERAFFAYFLTLGSESMCPRGMSAKVEV